MRAFIRALGNRAGKIMTLGRKQIDSVSAAAPPDFQGSYYGNSYFGKSYFGDGYFQ